MEEHLCRQNEDLHCDVLFTRLIQDWELESLQSFYSLLYSTNIGQNGVVAGQNGVKISYIIQF